MSSDGSAKSSNTVHPNFRFVSVKLVLFPFSHMYVQYHYDNPRLEPLVDNTGLRFWYTEQLRRYDAAVFGTGVNIPAISIPPGVPSVPVVGYCFSGKPLRTVYRQRTSKNYMRPRNRHLFNISTCLSDVSPNRVFPASMAPYRAKFKQFRIFSA